MSLTQASRDLLKREPPGVVNGVRALYRGLGLKLLRSDGRRMARSSTIGQPWRCDALSTLRAAAAAGAWTPAAARARQDFSDGIDARITALG